MSRTWPRTALLSLLSSRARLFVGVWNRPCCPDVEFIQGFLNELNDAGRANSRLNPSLGTVTWVRVPGTATVPTERHVVDGQRRLVACVVLLAALRDKMTEAKSADEGQIGSLAALQHLLGDAVRLPPVRLDGADGDALAAMVRGDKNSLPQESAVAQTYRVIQTVLLITEFDARRIFIGLRRATVDVVETDSAPEHSISERVFGQLNNQGTRLDLDGLHADPDWGRW